MSYIVRGVLLICVISASTLVFQNCSPKIEFQEKVVDLSVKSNGTGYGGMVYASRLPQGNCQDGSNIEARAILTKTTSGFDAVINRENCQNIPPRPVTVSEHGNAVPGYEDVYAYWVIEDKNYQLVSVLPSASESVSALHICKAFVNERLIDIDFSLSPPLNLGAPFGTENDMSRCLRVCRELYPNVSPMTCMYITSQGAASGTY